jgi:hypothetical protein
METFHPRHIGFLQRVGIPQAQIDEAQQAGLNWQEVLTLFVQYGLPVLIQILTALLHPTPPVP